MHGGECRVKERARSRNFELRRALDTCLKTAKRDVFRGAEKGLRV